MKKVLKNKNLLCLILIFIIGCLITFPRIVPSFNVDGYCLLAGGYLEQAKVFMKAGRIFTALIYVFNNFIKLPYKTFSVISYILSNLFIALSINKLADYLNKDNILKKRFTKVLLYISCGLIFYNPIISELFLFEESFIMFLGIYLVVESALKFYNNKLLLSFIYLLLATICYQGIICFYLPLIFLLLVINNNNFKDIIKKMFYACLFYGLSLIISYIFVKIINTFILTSKTQKIGHIDIFLNIKTALKLFLSSLITLFGYMNPTIYYLIISVLLIIMLLTKNKITMVYLILNIILACITPFIPNLGMNSAVNYTAARMCCSLGSIVGIIALYGLFKFQILDNINYDRIFIGIILLYTLYNCLFVWENSYTALTTYKKDMDSLNKIYEVIDNYEKNNGLEITTIYYALDKYVDWNYKDLYANSSNYRLFAVEWSMACAINMENRNYTFIKMSDEVKKKFFGDVDYKEFDIKQFVFIDNTLYLLLY